MNGGKMSKIVEFDKSIDDRQFKVLWNVKYLELVEDLKTNKDIKGLQRLLANHLLPMLENKDDQTIAKVVALLDKSYEISRTEKV